MNRRALPEWFYVFGLALLVASSVLLVIGAK